MVSQSSIGGSSHYSEMLRTLEEAQERYLQIQSSHYEEWKISEASLEQQCLLHFDRTERQGCLEINTLAATAQPSPPSLTGSWERFTGSMPMRLHYHMLRTVQKHSLRSLGVKVCLEVDIGSSSELWQ